MRESTILDEQGHVILGDPDPVLTPVSPKLGGILDDLTAWMTRDGQYVPSGEMEGGFIGLQDTVTPQALNNAVAKFQSAIQVFYGSQTALADAYNYAVNSPDPADYQRYVDLADRAYDLQGTIDFYVSTLNGLSFLGSPTVQSLGKLGALPAAFVVGGATVSGAAFAALLGAVTLAILAWSGDLGELIDKIGAPVSEGVRDLLKGGGAAAQGLGGFLNSGVMIGALILAGMYLYLNKGVKPNGNR